MICKILISLPCLLLASCVTTAGSRDAARVPDFAAGPIAKSMTRSLATYPERGARSPAGKPVYNAFNSEFSALGWNVEPSAAPEWQDEEMQRGNIRIFTSKVGKGRTLVELNTPYFSVYQLFALNPKTEECFELTNPTIQQKAHER